MKRWSHIRQKLEEDDLCPKLRGRVPYFATTYQRCVQVAAPYEWANPWVRPYCKERTSCMHMPLGEGGVLHLLTSMRPIMYC